MVRAVSSRPVLSEHNGREMVSVMTQHPDEFAWSERLALAVAQEVRRHRQARGLSAKQLSDRCAQLGMPIQRSVLANLESGRRATISVAEVMVLAAALEVAPMQLLFPVGYEERFEFLPNQHAVPFAAAQWFEGKLSLEGTPTKTEDSPLAAFSWHHFNIQRLEIAIFRRDEAVRRYIEARDLHDGLAARLIRVRGDIEILEQDPQVAEERRYERLRELRTEEADVRRQLDAEEWMREAVYAHDAEIADLAGMIYRVRKTMKERGWFPPQVNEKLAEYVEHRTIGSLETFKRPTQWRGITEG